MNGSHSTSTVAQDGDPLRLSRPLKALLASTLVAVTALFLAGTFHGSDLWWPFGPWRMYATSTAPSGPVGSTLIQVKEAGDDQWRPASLNPDTVGLNRAEIEGRMPLIQSDPSMLGTLLDSHARLLPDAPRWQAIRVVRSDILLENGVRTGEVRESTLAVWPESARTAQDDTPRILEEATP
ncbi:hypothetical protein [Kineosporia sp. NBRC 101731]|uniref:hypothetical protein n=1 Tax=Kineosporia sp. NBRC 101731 TaxID=3032199 RepID=UPI002557BE3B|nr:hypothetical protein [Kineosporia sp. NBRC 101731]